MSLAAFIAISDASPLGIFVTNQSSDNCLTRMCDRYKTAWTLA